jgi:hypothetical protein
LKNNKLQVNISNKFKKDLKKRLNNLVALKKPKRKKVWFFALPSFAICLLVFGVLCYYKDMNFFKNRGSDVNVLEFVPMSVRLGKLYDNTEQKESDEEQTVKNEEISGGNNIDKEEDLIEIISPSLKPNTNLVGCEIISI